MNATNVADWPGSAVVWREVPLQGADIVVARLYDNAAAASWLTRLMSEIAWERHRLRMFGRDIDAQRLSCWIGDPEAVYTYSRTRFEPRAWTPTLAQLRKEVEAAASARFNSVLCNLYRDGSDAMGWHSDNEPELGSRPVIASLSLGATRRFRIRHRANPDLRVELDLDSGSLLRMSGATQKNYRHDLPRTKRDCGPRINLTFRNILPPARR